MNKTKDKEIERPTPPFPKQKFKGEPPGLEEEMDPKPQYRGELYKAAGKLMDKVALITGGDSGIGRSVATLFAREGADIAIICLPEEKVDAEETIRAVEEAGRSGMVIMGDVSDYNFCQNAVSQVMDRFQKINILVNNAAYQNHVESLEELSLEQWDKTFRTNIYGYFHMAKSVLPYMKKGDCIINTSSITGIDGSSRLLDYSATKGAIQAFTKSLASNLVERGIRVNSVAPGPVWTPLNPVERSSQETKQFGSKAPMGRPAQPDEIAPAYVYFASNADSAYVTGETITLLGGDITAGS